MYIDELDYLNREAESDFPKTDENGEVVEMEVSERYDVLFKDQRGVTYLAEAFLLKDEAQKSIERLKEYLVTIISPINLELYEFEARRIVVD